MATHRMDLKQKQQSMLRWSAHENPQCPGLVNNKWFEFQCSRVWWQNDCTCHAQQQASWIIFEIPITWCYSQLLKFYLPIITSSRSCWKWSSSWYVADEQVIEQAHHAPCLIARRWSSRTPCLMANCHSGDACTSRRTRLMSAIVDPSMVHPLLIMRRWCNWSRLAVAFSLALPLPLPLPSLPPGAAADASENVPVICGWSGALIRDPYLRDRELAFVIGTILDLLSGSSLSLRPWTPRCIIDRPIVRPNENNVHATNLILIIDECIDATDTSNVGWDSCAFSITVIQLM